MEGVIVCTVLFIQTVHWWKVPIDHGLFLFFTAVHYRETLLFVSIEGGHSPKVDWNLCEIILLGKNHSCCIRFKGSDHIYSTKTVNFHIILSNFPRVVRLKYNFHS